MKKLNHFLQYIFINIFFLIFKILGFRKSSDLGNIIGKYLGPIFRSKKSIINNLEKAGINKNQNIIASNVLGNYGRILDMFILKTLKIINYINIFLLKVLNILKALKKTRNR